MTILEREIEAYTARIADTERLLAQLQKELRWRVKELADRARRPVSTATKAIR
jgi:hypothetical protein